MRGNAPFKSVRVMTLIAGQRRKLAIGSFAGSIQIFIFSDEVRKAFRATNGSRGSAIANVIYLLFDAYRKLCEPGSARELPRMDTRSNPGQRALWPDQMQWVQTFGNTAPNLAAQPAGHPQGTVPRFPGQFQG